MFEGERKGMLTFFGGRFSFSSCFLGFGGRFLGLFSRDAIWYAPKR